ncbi:MAG: DUF952 domain-containing protein [Chloroflexi bacterium]|nr:DUF952 domain-containing protein [Chloroflexota bacterium]
MSWIFRIARSRDWDRAQAAGQYWVTAESDALDGPGFIRASTMEQVADVANLWYTGAEDLVVLVIDAGRLQPQVRFLQAADSPRFFPHIYGPINLDAVVGAISLEPMPDGLFRFQLSEDSLLSLYLASGQYREVGVT